MSVAIETPRSGRFAALRSFGGAPLYWAGVVVLPLAVCLTLLVDMPAATMAWTAALPLLREALGEAPVEDLPLL